MRLRIYFRMKNLITLTRKINQVSIILVLTSKEYSKIQKEVNDMKDISIDESNLEISKMFTQEKDFKIPFEKRLARMSHQQHLDLLSKYGNLCDRYGNTLAHEMLCWGASFSIDEIITIGNPSNNVGVSIAHDMIHRGYKFKASDIIRLGNPKDGSGITLSGAMASKGYSFDIDDLILLDKDNDNNNAAFSTIYWTAFHGHKFDELDLLKLKHSPLNKYVKIVVKLMEKNGFIINDALKRQLDLIP